MKELHIFYAPGLPVDTLLPSDEAAHAVRVLRMKEDDLLVATDGRGNFYDCNIATASPKQCGLNVMKTTATRRYWNGRIELALAPTKNMDRTEWLAEKATEIGFDALTFIDTHNSERHVVKPERLERIIVSAMKQSHKAFKPLLTPMMKFEDFIDRPYDGQKFIAHCNDMDAMPGMTADTERKLIPTSSFLADVVDHKGASLVLIGPEGDFTPEEVRRAINVGFRPVSLGKGRLRTETAALFAVQIMQLAKRKTVDET